MSPARRFGSGRGEVDGGLACNCSMCSRKGSLLWFVPREQLRLHTAEDAASTYLFNKHVAAAVRPQPCAAGPRQ